jgi:predicted DNA-binding transcriptional regulator YafY
MYHPTTRVLTVLELLQAHQRLSGPQLAARLEVSERTVRRYITMLQDLGIPVEAERGRHGAYWLRPGFKLPPLMFGDDEALALTLGLLLARRVGLAAAAPAVEGALAKIERVLPLALREQVQAVQETIVLDVGAAEVAPPSAVVALLSIAAQQRRRVQLEYRAFRAEPTMRLFEPYGLVYQDRYWYAAGYCHLRAGLRTFRLDRVVQAELCGETFTRPADFDTLAYVTQSRAQTPGPWRIEALLRCSLERALCHIPPTVATLEQTAEGVVLRCWVRHLDELAHQLVGLDCDLVVREPAELRAELARLATRIARLAANTE